MADGIVVITAGKEWITVPNALGREDRRLPRAATGESIEAAESLARQAQRRVRRVQVVGGPEGSTGLRRRVAAGVRVRPRGSGARVTTSMANRDEAIIPRGLDRKQGWRHPVYGNKNEWVRSRPSNPGWFTDTFEDGKRPLEESLTDEIEKSANNIARAGNSRFRPG